MQSGYPITVHKGREFEDVAFWAEVPALQGCFAQGDAYDETVANAEEAIRAYVDSLRCHGEPVPPFDTLAPEIRPSRSFEETNPCSDERHIAIVYERAGFVEESRSADTLLFYHPASKRRLALTMNNGFVESALLERIVEHAGLSDRDLREIDAAIESNPLL